MNRWVLSFICTGLAGAALVCGLGVPAHLRAVDTRVLEQAGRKTPTLIEAGLALVKGKNPGPAQLLLAAAEAANVPGQDKLRRAVDNLVKRTPAPEPFTDFIIQTDNRETALAQLGASSNPAVQELLQTRALTNTAVFSPSPSAAGQAFDATIAMCGRLVESGHLSSGLSGTLARLAAEANRSGGDSQPLEQALLDFLSLGRRFDRAQLEVFVKNVGDAGTLHTLADAARQDGDLPVLFAAVEMSGQPANVARYLSTFSETGLQDIRAALRFGAGGVRELLRRDQRFYESNVRQPLAADLALKNPALALTLKWVLYLVAGYLLALAAHFALQAAFPLARPLQVRGPFHVAREILFALGFWLVVMLLSEPFLAQDNQRVEFHLLVRLPTTGGALAAGSGGKPTTFMNQLSLLTLLLFFVLQALIYVACLVKLAEIRRLDLPARLRLKLLENEEHLFDAGLYLGFAGTIISLILVSLGVIKPSLMAAYSSTSFGIIFVSVFKIFHLRPLKRKLLLEAENIPPAEPAAPPAPVTPL
jgi:hypothetical protein